MDRTDEELDRDWKPNGRRPQSTIARSFSQELMDIFRIENSVADLDAQVDKRRHVITDRTNELQSLEARIREMEERLKQNGVTPAPVKTTQSQPSSPYTARTAAAEVAAAHDSSAVPPPQFEPTAATRRPQQPAQPPLRRPQPTQEEDEDDDEDDEEEESSEEDSDKVLPPRPIAKDYKDYASPRQQHQQFVQRTRGASVPMPKYASNASSARTGAAGARPGGAMPPTPVASEGEYEAQQQQNHLHRRLHPASPTAISLSSSMYSEGDGGTASGPDDYADFVVVSKDGDDDN